MRLGRDFFYQTITFIICGLLASCGGGGGGGSPTREVKEVTLQPPELTLKYSAAETFRFSWKDVEGAAYYNLLERVDGESDFEVIRENIKRETGIYVLNASYESKLDAQYRLQACKNENECKASSPVVVREMLAQLIPTKPLLDYRPVKTLRFTWQDSAGATHYRLLESIDGFADYEIVVENIPQGLPFFDYVVPLYLKTQAHYIVETCEHDRCVASNPIAVESGIENAVGQFKASNSEAGDTFGTGVALSADGLTMAVGAHHKDGISIGENDEEIVLNEMGAAYVFVNEGGQWKEQAFIQPADGATEDKFGLSVALSDDGNTLAVGARDRIIRNVVLEDKENGIEAVNATGAVYIYNRDSNGNWTQTFYAEPGITDNTGHFGYSIDLSGDGRTLAVGSPKSNVDPNAEAPEKGAVYVYTLNSSEEWSYQAKLENSVGETKDWLGVSVALDDSGDVLAAGGGKVFSEDFVRPTLVVFNRANDSWGDSKGVGNYCLSDVDQNCIKYRHMFSVALSGDGNTLAVKVNKDSEVLNVKGSGEALIVYEHVNGEWGPTYVDLLNFTSEKGRYEVGDITINADGTLIAVGESNDDSSGTGFINRVSGDSFDSGAVIVYQKQFSRWAEKLYIKPPTNSTRDRFGRFLQLSADGNTLAVSSYLEDSVFSPIGPATVNDAAEDSGAVYLY